MGVSKVVQLIKVPCEKGAPSDDSHGQYCQSFEKDHGSLALPQKAATYDYMTALTCRFTLLYKMIVSTDKHGSNSTGNMSQEGTTKAIFFRLFYYQAHHWFF